MVVPKTVSHQRHRRALTVALLLAAASLSPAAAQAQAAPADFPALPCGDYTVSAILRVDNGWRYCTYYWYWLEGTGPTFWRSQEFSAPVTAFGALPIDGAPALAVLVEDGTMPTFRCDGAPAGNYDFRSMLQPQPVSMVAGTISADPPQLRLFGVGREAAGLVVFGFDLDVADLDASPPVAAQRIRWKRRFDGVDLPSDASSLRSVWVSDGDVLVQTAVRDPDGDCFSQQPFHSYVTYKLDGETGALLEPVWLGALEIDPDVPAGTAVRALALDGSVAWSVDFGARVFAVAQLGYTRDGWRGRALVDADSLTGAPPRLFSLAVTGTATKTQELRAVPNGTQVDDRVLGGFLPVGATPYGICDVSQWGILVVQSQSAAATRVVAVNVFELLTRDIGTFQGAVTDRRGWRFLVGQDRNGHAAALSCGFSDCWGQANTLVLDGASFGRPAETSFERIEDIPERQEVVAVASSGRRYHFEANDYAYRPLPTDHLTFEGSTLRAWDDAGTVVGEIELPAPIVAAYGGPGRAQCLLRGVHGPAVASIEAAAELRLYRYEALTAEGCPAEVAGFSPLTYGTGVASGQDYIVYSDLYSQSPFSSFVHSGALEQTMFAYLGTAGKAYELLLGRVSQTNSPDLVCMDSPMLTGPSGACAAVPRWTARWDGSQPGRPLRTGLPSMSVYNDGGGWLVAVTMADGVIELVGDSGAVPLPMELLAAGEIAPGGGLDVLLRVRRAPSFQGGHVYFEFDPAVIELGSARLTTATQQLGIAVKEWEVGHGTARLSLTSSQPLPITVMSFFLAIIQVRVRAEAAGDGAIRVVAPTAMQRSDGSQFLLQMGELPYSIPCTTHDVDADGAVTVADAVLVLRQVVGLDEPTPRQRCAADADVDQQVTIADAIAVLRRAAGIAKSQPEGPRGPAGANGSTGPVSSASLAQDVYWRLVHDAVAGQTRSWTAQLDAPEPIVGFSIETSAPPGAVASISAPAAAGWLSAASSGAAARMAAVTMQPATAQALISMSSTQAAELDALLVLAGMAVGQSGTHYRWAEHRLAREDAQPPPAPAIVRTAIHQNHPNPFNPRTAIHFDLAEGGPISLRVFDAHGRCVRALVDGWMPAGAHVTTWDGRDATGSAVASGVYWYRLRAAAYEDVRSMTLVR